MENLKIHAVFLTLFLACTVSSSQTIDHWESILQVGDSCMYFVPSSELLDDWTSKDFDDSGWQKGKSGLGYGDDDDHTILAEGTVCAYMRFDFDVQEKSDIGALYLDVDYDDGFVAYLNGVEVARANVVDPISWNMELEDIHEAVMYSGLNPERFDISPFISSILQAGVNVLSLEVHNEQASSSDMSANVFLHAGISNSNSYYSSVPDWFGPPVTFEEFNLPLMVIQTNGQEIPDEPRIVADMGLIVAEEGKLNSPEDEWNEYSGKISIERRGESSAGFAKRSYSIELQKEDGTNNNVSILGLPIENDFVLYGPYSDKTMMKNVLSYELFRRTGRWAPRTRYIEIILNDEYRGVYVLTEKLKRDENRVDIDKITPEDVSAEDISGGYILRRDKTADTPALSWWTSPVEQPYHERMWYSYFDPEYDELSFAQSSYIRTWMKQFDVLMSSANFSDPDNGYSAYIKTKSFMDMMFLNEISKGIDNYLFSTYFHKENDADGGQLIAGPPWDYNLGYGNLDYGDGWDAKETYGWCYTQGSRVYWFERLMEDERYRKRTACRWKKFRNTIYSDVSIMGIIDSCTTELGDAVDRNFAKYPTLGKYVWPGLAPYPESYDEEVSILKTWLVDRLAWIDSQWLPDAICSETPTDIVLSNNEVSSGLLVGSLVGDLLTRDEDSDEHDYSFAMGEGDDDNSRFALVGNSLYSNSVIDYDEQAEFSIRVRTEDEASETFDKALSIYVLEDISSRADELFASSLSLYPNPSSGGVQLSANFVMEKDIKVQLVDMSGKVLLDYTGLLQEINSKLMNDSEALSSGVYLIKVHVSGYLEALKFMKL